MFRNLTGEFDLHNKYPRLIRALFRKEFKDKESTYPLDVYKSKSMPGKILKMYEYTLELFEYLHFQVRGNIKPVNAIEMQNAVDQGMKYWKVDEANGNGQKAQNLPEADDDDGRIDAALGVEDEGLS